MYKTFRCEFCHVELAELGGQDVLAGHRTASPACIREAALQEIDYVELMGGHEL